MHVHTCTGDALHMHMVCTCIRYANDVHVHWGYVYAYAMHVHTCTGAALTLRHTFTNCQRPASSRGSCCGVSGGGAFARARSVSFAPCGRACGDNHSCRLGHIWLQAGALVAGWVTCSCRLGRIGVAGAHRGCRLGRIRLQAGAHRGCRAAPAARCGAALTPA